jgi:[glutamine synthetase] adenylyltransferase / [glutamine synthetase]-adenylyl-L-tyrosine phosphorylase
VRIGSRDLGSGPLEEVTGELSALAAVSLQRAYEVCERLLRSDGGHPFSTRQSGSLSPKPEFTIFGMGKFGGRELNFSSDIDLIYFYSSEKGTTAGIARP